MESSAEQAQSHNMHQHHQHAGDETFSLHIIGMWFNFALSAILISFFIVRMNLEIKQQADKINQQREQMLRDEQVLGIATQAASAAHHMSTPLASMAVLIEDLKHDYQEGELAEDLNLLAAQIASCTQVLDNLRDQARLRSRSESIADFTQRLIDECRLLRPNTRIETEHRYSQIQGKYTISSDPALRMAILNILNNAADVSPQHVYFAAYVEENLLNIKVRDFAENDANHIAKILNAAEQPQDSGKDHGMGIGLFLSHATINRHQGSISIDVNQTPGTQVHVRLPLLTTEPQEDA